MDKYFLFSGGEVHIRLEDTLGMDGSSYRMVCRDYTMNGFMSMCLHNEVIKRHGLKANLIYPYFPYARQDRVMQGKEPFSLKVFCGLLNSQGFESVTIYDPHSDVAPALINNCRVITQWDIARNVIPDEYFDEHLFVSPDAGAHKKLAKLISDDCQIAIGIKKRDMEGNIAHTDVFSSAAIAGRDCVIVDDICDGGRTFIELAKALRAKGAKSVTLYVTHGIFSNGFDELKQHIDRIHTTNTFPNEPTEFLHVKGII